MQEYPPVFCAAVAGYISSVSTPTERLRVTLSAAHSEADVEALLDALAAVLQAQEVM